MQGFDDLVFCSDEALYFTAHLYLYRPYINSPIKDRFWHVNRWVYPNHQNLAAKRYAIFANTICEKVYNYWDRVGDILAAYFPDLIEPSRVYFPTIIDKIPSSFHECLGFAWLKNFREIEYRELNSLRKKVVHYNSVDTALKHEHLKDSSDLEAIEEWVAKRHGLADYYKQQLSYMLDGFVNMLILIEDITAIKLSHIP